VRLKRAECRSFRKCRKERPIGFHGWRAVHLILKERVSPGSTDETGNIVFRSYLNNREPITRYEAAASFPEGEQNSFPLWQKEDSEDQYRILRG